MYLATISNKILKAVMLSKINIRKFRSCTNVKLNNAHDILVLIGRNGAGKTNILKAIEWACKFASDGLENQTPQSFYRQQDFDVALEFSIDGETYCYEARKIVLNDIIDANELGFRIEEKISLCNGIVLSCIVFRNGEHVQLYDESGNQSNVIEISKTIPCLIAIGAFFPEDSNIKQIAGKILEFLSSVKYYPLHNFDEVIKDTYIFHRDYKKWKSEKIKNLNSMSVIQYKLLDLFIERKESLSELISLIGPDGLGLIKNIKIVEHVFDKDSSLTNAEVTRNAIYFLTFEQPGSSGEDLIFSVNDLSFGTKRMLFLLISMLYDKASVSLLEQPEDGVHSGLVDKLVPLFRSYSKKSQFIIATHSTTILNKSVANEIFLISNVNGETSSRPLSSDELIAAENFLRDDGPLSEFLDVIGDD